MRDGFGQLINSENSVTWGGWKRDRAHGHQVIIHSNGDFEAGGIFRGKNDGINFVHHGVGTKCLRYFEKGKELNEIFVDF